jgi:hypothetical protein
MQVMKFEVGDVIVTQGAIDKRLYHLMEVTHMFPTLHTVCFQSDQGKGILHKYCILLVCKHRNIT